MRIPKKIIQRVSILSATVAVVFFVVSLFFYLTSPTLDYMMVIALAIGVSPPSVASIIHNQMETKNRKSNPRIPKGLSHCIKNRYTLQIALEHASNRMYGPLTYELKLLVAHMSWGMSFNDALMEFSDRIDLPLVKRATILIIEAGKHGGDLSDIFESTAKYVEDVNGWTEKRRQQTLPYVAIFYFSVFMFLFIIIVISSMMFAPLSKTTSTSISFIKPILISIAIKPTILAYGFAGITFRRFNCRKNQRRLIRGRTKTCNRLGRNFRSGILFVSPLSEQN